MELETVSVTATQKGSPLSGSTFDSKSSNGHPPVHKPLPYLPVQQLRMVDKMGMSDLYGVENFKASEINRDMHVCFADKTIRDCFSEADELFKRDVSVRLLTRLKELSTQVIAFTIQLSEKSLGLADRKMFLHNVADFYRCIAQRELERGICLTEAGKKEMVSERARRAEFFNSLASNIYMHLDLQYAPYCLGGQKSADALTKVFQTNAFIDLDIKSEVLNIRGKGQSPVALENRWASEIVLKDEQLLQLAPAAIRAVLTRLQLDGNNPTPAYLFYLLQNVERTLVQVVEANCKSFLDETKTKEEYELDLSARVAKVNSLMSNACQQLAQLPTNDVGVATVLREYATADNRLHIAQYS